MQVSIIRSIGDVSGRLTKDSSFYGVGLKTVSRVLPVLLCEET